ncbi:hypothetical protein LOAG_08951 [Loa loa]|uniref:Uncharacterized protein n=1 Tax=Loa loa TaxID=7209 RepID=A0A1S0TST9_LOALO|nr:hypothetical protein LOAG_08951 [Loa loa]EFO19541.1 hypothetical protein LOAG_08951 [Loa loa]
MVTAEAIANINKFWEKSSEGNEDLGDEERSDRSSEVDNNQLRAIIEVNPLTTTQEAAEKLNVSHPTVGRSAFQVNWEDEKGR